MHKPDQGLYLVDIDPAWKLMLDPENIFWGLIKKDNQGFYLPEDLLGLYKKQKRHLDTELHNFRFEMGLNSIYIDPTDRCNANCPYCYIPLKIRKQGTQMTPESLDVVLKKIKTYFKGRKKKPVIIFHAAEPLLVKEMLFDAIRKYSKSFLFGIQTNGTLLEKKDVEFIKIFRIGIGISLDAPTPDINNHMRAISGGSGNFDKAVRALEWFDGYEGLNVISTVTKYNVATLSELVQFLHAKKVSSVLFNPVRLTMKSAVTLKPDEMIYAENLIRAVETAMELSHKTGQQIIVGNFTNVILAIIAPTARRMMCDISPCGAGRTFLTVTANGDIVPCGEFIGFKEFSGANIFKSSLEDALQSKVFHEIRERTVEKIDECRTCIFRHICGAPCPAELYARGNMFHKAEYCEFYKKMIVYAFKLIAEDKVKYLLRHDAVKQMEYDYTYADNAL